MAIDKKQQIERAPAYPASQLNARERKVLETADQYVPANSAHWPVAPQGVDDALDKLAANSSSAASQEVAVVEYDFAASGGDIGSVNLGHEVPDGAVVVEVVREVIAAPDSADDEGTLRLNLPTDGNLDAAITADGAASGVAAASEPPVKASDDRELRVTIATSALTAGRVRWRVRYYLPA